MVGSLPIFVLTTLLMLVVPGPDFVLVTRNTIAGSRVQGYLTAVGICVSLAFLTVCTASGVAALIARNGTVLAVLRIVGGGYLLWLALQLLQAAARRREPGQPAHGTPIRGGPPVLQGFLNNVLNPKALVFYLTFVPQFLDPKHAVFGQTAVLGLLVVCCAAAWWGVYITAIGSLNALLTKPSVQFGLDIGAGIALAGIGIAFITGQL